MWVTVFFILISNTLAVKQNPKVIIVGAGASGIAAASKLVHNGVQNLVILEAEDRIGGRVYSTKFGEYPIDLGGEWVHGDTNNVVFDLANPLGLLSYAPGPGEPDEKPRRYDFYGSNGMKLPHDVSENLIDYATASSKNETEAYEQDDYNNQNDTNSLNSYLENRTTKIHPDYVISPRHSVQMKVVTVDGETHQLKESPKAESLGDHVIKKLNKYFQNHSKEIPKNLWHPLIHSLHLTLVSWEGAPDWHNVSFKGALEYEGSDGYEEINWKNGTYGIILDILMKKYPNPNEELPVMQKILFNKTVTQIKYYDKGQNKTKVTTADGQVFEADHVICTVPLGVLKAMHGKLFDPPLPEINLNAIKNLGYGPSAKIFLYYEQPWWDTTENYMKLLYWTDADRNEIENDPQRSWMLGVAHAMAVEYKPKLLFFWMSGLYCEQMEKISDKLFRTQIIWLIEKFFGKSYNLTEPKDIIRTSWNSNQNFRGAYSYPALTADAAGARYEHLGKPLMRDGKPVLQFAGEATDQVSYSTVHGAIVAGWREADRIIEFYNNQKS